MTIILSISHNCHTATDFPVGSVIGPNSSTEVGALSDFPSSRLEFREWNPKFTFQFAEGSSAGLQVVKSVLIGQIKSYNSVQDALTNAGEIYLLMNKLHCA